MENLLPKTYVRLDSWSDDGEGVFRTVTPAHPVQRKMRETWKMDDADDEVATALADCGPNRKARSRTDGSEQNGSEQNSAVGRVGLFTDSDEFLVLA